MSKQYEPTIEGHYEKCCDERDALKMQLEEYKEAFEFARKEFHETLDDLAKMQEERDAARREVLIWMGERCSRSEMTQEIKERGWGYLKEDGK